MEEKSRACPDPKCGALIGHHPQCDLINLEEAKRQLQTYYKLWLEKEIWATRRVKLAHEEINKWKGKAAILKHENNQLRKMIVN